MQSKIVVELLENNQLTDDIYQLVFEVKNSREWSFIPGQYVLISKLFEGKMVRRAYSISSVCEDLPKLELTVRCYPNGKMSNYLTKMELGHNLELEGAFGEFNVDRLRGKQACLIGIGCGIAPLKSMVTFWCQNKMLGIKSDLFFGNRFLNSIPYHNYFENCMSENLAFNYVPCITRPEIEDFKYKGRVNEIMDEMNYEMGDKEFFISGTMEMVKDMTDLIIKKGGKKENIYFENIYPFTKKDSNII